MHPLVAAGVLFQDYAGPFDWLCTRENPYKGKLGYVNLQLACAKMKRVALAENYDYVWIVESDTAPPTHALRTLIETAQETQSEIVTGLYVLRHGAHVPNLFTCGNAPEIGSGFEWDALRAHVAKGMTTIPVGGGCMGCVLVHPDALDFDFEIYKTETERPYAAPDMAWMRHNWKTGHKTMARLDVRAGHIESDGNVLRVETFL